DTPMHGVRACRVGTAGDCCGDGVVGPSETCDRGGLPPDACCDTTCHLRAAGDACTDDGNACTSEACNASGTCVHASLPAGTACTTDHNACTTDTCDAAGACIHPAVADGTACVADTDACTDDVCQSGTCLGVPLPD